MSQDKKEKPSKAEHKALRAYMKGLKTKGGKVKYTDANIDVLVGVDETIYTREQYTQRLIAEMQAYSKA